MSKQTGVVRFIENHFQLAELHRGGDVELRNTAADRVIKLERQLWDVNLAHFRVISDCG